MRLQYTFNGYTSSLIHPPNCLGPLLTVNFRWGVGDEQTGALIAGAFKERLQSHRSHVSTHIHATLHD